MHPVIPCKFIGLCDGKERKGLNLLFLLQVEKRAVQGKKRKKHHSLTDNPFPHIVSDSQISSGVWQTSRCLCPIQCNNIYNH